MTLEAGSPKACASKLHFLSLKPERRISDKNGYIYFDIPQNMEIADFISHRSLKITSIKDVKLVSEIMENK
jgi:hypothetical protein